jgi:hypothetical protein
LSLGAPDNPTAPALIEFAIIEKMVSPAYVVKLREKKYAWCPDITLSSEELPSAGSGELLFRLCLPVSLNSQFRVSWDGKGVKSERGSITEIPL